MTIMRYIDFFLFRLLVLTNKFVIIIRQPLEELLIKLIFNDKIFPNY